MGVVIYIIWDLLVKDLIFKVCIVGSPTAGHVPSFLGELCQWCITK